MSIVETSDGAETNTSEQTCSCTALPCAHTSTAQLQAHPVLSASGINFYCEPDDISDKSSDTSSVATLKLDNSYCLQESPSSDDVSCSDRLPKQPDSSRSVIKSSRRPVSTRSELNTDRQLSRREKMYENHVTCDKRPSAQSRTCLIL